MCQLKSGIILKDRVFVPEYDSHTDMLEELGIKDTQANAEKLFVRAELLPPNGDVFKPVDEWKFHVDQDIIPDWFIEEVDKERMVEAVKEWAKDHVHIGVNGLRIQVSGCHYVKDCKNVEAYNSATVKAYGSATVKAYNSATVEAYDSATVKAYGSATVEAYGSATVKAYDSATVEAYNSATVEAYNSATVEAYGSATVMAYGSATVKAYGSATVKAYDSATVEAYNSATVKAYDSATVEAYNSATVKAYNSATVEAYDSATVEACGSATVIIPNFSLNNRKNIIISENATIKDCNTKTIWQSGDWSVQIIKGGENDGME